MMQVLSAFALSGVMHMGLMPPEPRGTGMGPMEMRMKVAGFFWVQVLGIGVEVFVEGVLGMKVSRWGKGGLGKVGRMLWVVVWLSYTLPLLAIPFRELGYWRYPPLPVSAVAWVSGRGWWVW